MRHPHPLVSAFLSVPEWSWKNRLRRWLAFTPCLPPSLQDYSPLKGYEKFRQLRTGDVVVDAGAYPGDYTLLASLRVGPTGKVYALEPDPGNRRLLESHLKRAGADNVVVLPFALWSTSTRLWLEPDGVASCLQTEPAQTASSSVEAITLDELCLRLNLHQLQILKMDIEGAELQALDGAVETLRRFRPHVCVASYHLLDGIPTAERVEARLRAAGLQVHTDYPRHLTTYADPLPIFGTSP